MRAQGRVQAPNGILAVQVLVNVSWVEQNETLINIQ